MTDIEQAAGDGAGSLAEAVSAFADWDAMLTAARERVAPAPLVGFVLVRCRSGDCPATGSSWEIPVTESATVRAPGWGFCSLCATALDPLRVYTMAERSGVWAEFFTAAPATTSGEPVRCGAYL